MHGPATPGWLLVVLCTVSGLACLARARGGPGRDGPAAGGEAVMAFAMALMALPAALPGPAERGPLLAVVCSGAALHALWHAGRSPRSRGHHAHHLVGSLAMVYMVSAMPLAGGHGTGGHGIGGAPQAGASGVPLLTGALLLYYAVYALRAGRLLLPATVGNGVPAGSGASDGAGRGDGVGAELVRACRPAMALAMFAMLLTV
ncbi:DUF5134 domain-containing protein [Streptomyces sp. NPDC097619]|uniref:DUF5134 domain-containing protein n=1 Tax=Streptomyces sp. NPDC097619 TaxID=3157228 RepID=UPI00332AC929